ncbi:mitochondrial lysine biosynthesis saccharopine dehydrogenase [Andalucia godoyi]|uniref:Mitochondrial lysine biosynthesis saccharopine dehydrogenase n=1 Tax=Andalucia godoyi TaxID=505711 RepID=A0A8K0AHT8_ANDGO|nr:mitochondrial lysine biosynthesis saccharopine dehydrogenase [Andalucia godoyi]|eukprot:ANDGO_00993.mRNA.1 mitochondrial lysine biosynthesis saccharopine dehydrogenase
MKASRKILVLGSGFVSAGFVNYFVQHGETNVKLTIASNLVDQAQKLIDEFAPEIGHAIFFDLKDEAANRKLIKEHDVVVSLLPATLHVVIAKLCVEEKKNMVTTSYISSEMAGLDAAAKAAGIIIMNEIGLDPGIDHCSAKAVFDDIHARGGNVTGFVSYCGGLPAPENSRNPLGYKFSWNPRGVLTAAEAPARFLWNGEVVEYDAGETYAHAIPQKQYPGFNLEGVANRDSIKYRELYDIPEAETVLRGTLRFPGFATMVLTFRALGLTDTTEYGDGAAPATWPALLSRVLNVPQDISSLRAAVEAKVQERFAGSQGRVKDALNGLQWFGVFLETTKVDLATRSPIDSLTSLLNAKLVYGKGERDLVILTHEFTYQLPDQPRSHGATGKQRKTSTLVLYGDPIGSHRALTAMARCVGIPCAIATHLVLDGVITRTGVCGPMTPDLYKPLLASLAQNGIHLDEFEEDVVES